MDAGLSEAQKRTLRIADNKIALNAGWDLEILHLELGELGSIDVDIDLALTGFSTGEIDVILTSPVDPDDEVITWQPSGPGVASVGSTSIRPMSMWRSNAGRRGRVSSRA